MIFPKKLKPGDCIGLVCPSSPIPHERLAECIKCLEDMGFRVKAADNICKNHGGYMAGSGAERGEWINRMFADDGVDAVFCVRGGDGGTRAAEHLDLELIAAHPKIFVGYSDITTLHLLLNQRCGLVTFHGPMVSSNMVDAFDEDTKSSFFSCVNASGSYSFHNPEGYEIGIMKPGRARGKLIGGNLSLLSAAIGTPYEPDCAGKILFIEEVEEPVTKIEKWMYQLRASGKLASCAGILLGQFTDITNKEMPAFTELDCIREVLEGIDVPVMYNLQSGHGEKIITLPFGAECEMDTGKSTIVFDFPERD